MAGVRQRAIESQLFVDHKLDLVICQEDKIMDLNFGCFKCNEILIARRS